jgi:ATP-dependent DNA helicase RecG
MSNYNGHLLDTPIEFMRGVGPQRAKILQSECEVRIYADLLKLYPNRYIDKTKYYKISALQDAQADVQIIGKVVHLKTIEQKRGKRLVARFIDDTGEIELVWFQSIAWIKDNIKLNEAYVIFGKVAKFGQNLSMVHPDMELLEKHQAGLKSGLQAIYPSTEKLAKNNLNNRFFIKLFEQLFTETSARFEETLPSYLLKELSLISKSEALFYVHFPKDQEILGQARRRLKFEELFYIQLQLLIKNLIRKHKIKGHKFGTVGNFFNHFYQNHLPFELTNAQKRVLKEIRNDMGQEAQMNRLLQGDVGSGKTIVAFMCVLMAKDNGFQSCIMAPTEILAQQHFASMQNWCEDAGITMALLTGSTKTAVRKVLHEQLLDGTLDLIVGTHALIEDVVQFKNIGLAIIDEQHRFGVEQRAKLWKKNVIPPHVLVMTATPIPRTLAMSLYGDLDISVIDELPPGRKPIQTIHQFDSNRLKVWKFIRDEIAKGRQIYIVYPLIQESEKMDYKDLMDGYESISRDFPLPDYAVSIVHGKMKPAEKDAEMKRFSQGKTQIMVATTVIEVGVNVPNASVMIIESAERFGLSQLHQLRGRVGRGADQSYCVLMTSFKLSNDSKTRIETMVSTNDGFEIAEVDLKLRGPGDLMGTQQSGVLQLQIADIVKDKDLLVLARQMAVNILTKDPQLQLNEHLVLRNILDLLSRKQSIWNYIS